jgi:hypothetical protein
MRVFRGPRNDRYSVLTGITDKDTGTDRDTAITDRVGPDHEAIGRSNRAGVVFLPLAGLPTPMTNWRAVGYGFVVTFLVGVIGLAIPGLGQLTAGLIGGFVAGYLAAGGLLRGFWHGLLAGSIGGLVVGLLLWAAIAIVGLAGGPVGAAAGALTGFGVFAIAALIAMVMALESAVAGAIGAVLNGDPPKGARAGY